MTTRKNDLFRRWGNRLKSGKRGDMKSRHLASLPKDDKLFFTVFQYAAIGMALVRLDGTWLMINKALCSLVGYSEEDLLKLSFQDTKIFCFVAPRSTRRARRKGFFRHLRDLRALRGLKNSTIELTPSLPLEETMVMLPGEFEEVYIGL